MSLAGEGDVEAVVQAKGVRVNAHRESRVNAHREVRVNAQIEVRVSAHREGKG